MEERLTRNSKFSIYNQDNLDAMYDKLAEIEDIMEKYDIESLDTLEHIIKKGKIIIAMADNISNKGKKFLGMEAKNVED